MLIEQIELSYPYELYAQNMDYVLDTALLFLEKRGRKNKPPLYFGLNAANV